MDLDGTQRSRLATLAELPEPGSRRSSFEEEVAAAFSNVNVVKDVFKNLSEEHSNQNQTHSTPHNIGAMYSNNVLVPNIIRSDNSNVLAPCMKRSDSEKSGMSIITVVPAADNSTAGGVEILDQPVLFNGSTINKLLFKPINTRVGEAESMHPPDDSGPATSASSKRTLFHSNTAIAISSIDSGSPQKKASDEPVSLAYRIGKEFKNESNVKNIASDVIGEVDDDNIVGETNGDAVEKEALDFVDVDDLLVGDEKSLNVTDTSVRNDVASNDLQLGVVGQDSGHACSDSNSASDRQNAEKNSNKDIDSNAENRRKLVNSTETISSVQSTDDGIGLSQSQEDFRMEGGDETQGENPISLKDINNLPYSQTYTVINRLDEQCVREEEVSITSDTCNDTQQLIQEIRNLLSRSNTVGSPSRALENATDVSHCSDDNIINDIRSILQASRFGGPDEFHQSVLEKEAKSHDTQPHDKFDSLVPETDIQLAIPLADDVVGHSNSEDDTRPIEKIIGCSFAFNTKPEDNVIFNSPSEMGVACKEGNISEISAVYVDKIAGVSEDLADDGLPGVVETIPDDLSEIVVINETELQYIPASDNGVLSDTCTTDNENELTLNEAFREFFSKLKRESENNSPRRCCEGDRRDSSPGNEPLKEFFLKLKEESNKNSSISLSISYDNDSSIKQDVKVKDELSNSSMEKDVESHKTAKNYFTAAFHSLVTALGKYQDAKQSKSSDEVKNATSNEVTSKKMTNRELNEHKEKIEKTEKQKTEKQKSPKRTFFKLFNHKPDHVVEPVVADIMDEGKGDLDPSEESAKQLEVTNENRLDRQLTSGSQQLERSNEKNYCENCRQNSSPSSRDNMSTLSKYASDSRASSDDTPPVVARTRRKRTRIKQLKKGLSVESSGIDDGSIKYPSLFFKSTPCVPTTPGLPVHEPIASSNVPVPISRRMEELKANLTLRVEEEEEDGGAKRFSQVRAKSSDPYLIGE